MKILVPISIVVAVLFSNTTLTAEDNGCPELDKLSAKDRSLLLKYQGHKKACQTAKIETLGAAPAEQILRLPQLEIYRNALKKGDCYTAQSLIIKTLQRIDKRFSVIVEDMRNFRVWEIYVVSTKYPEISFCIAVKKIREGQLAIQQLGLHVERIRNLTTPRYHGLQFIDARNSGIASLSRLADNDYAPALIELSILSKEGKILSLSPANEYSLLKRAEFLGSSDPRLEGLLAQTRRHLSIDQVSKLDSKVKQRPLDTMFFVTQ